MIDRMRVSVAMCTYNGEKFLQEQLHSILQQSRQPDELVVCEDASSDATLNILETFKQLAPFDVRIYINDSNLGYVKNFEQAISRCNGEIILCSDQDDNWCRDRVERSIAVFRDNPDCGYVFSDAGLIDAEGEQIRDTLWGRIKFTPDRWQTFKDMESQAAILYPRNCVTGATLAFRAKYREKLFPVPKLNIVIHDGWIAVILSLYGHYGIALKEPLIFYRSHTLQSRGIGKSFIRKLHLIFIDPGEEVSDIIFDLSVIQSHISDARNPAAMTRVERTFGELMNQLNTRLQLLNMSSRLRRIIPLINLYRCDGYAYCPSPRLSALRDMIF